MRNSHYNRAQNSRKEKPASKTIVTIGHRRMRASTSRLTSLPGIEIEPDEAVVFIQDNDGKYCTSVDSDISKKGSNSQFTYSLFL